LALHSDAGTELGINNGGTSFSPAEALAHSANLCACDPAPLPRTSHASRPLRREELARLAVLLAVCDSLTWQKQTLLNLKVKEWDKLLRWLDLSGMALYFLDWLAESNLCGMLPAAVLTRLERNLVDNTERTRSMISESIAIQREFQKAGIQYANLKGLSLYPNSVPKPGLRLQFDLDFLVAERHMPEARTILERRGYRLNLMSGRSWEFKFNQRPWLELRDIYNDFNSYGVDLHAEASIPGRPSSLDRLEWRELYGLTMPSLSPVDLLLGQGLHAFKHIWGGYSRASHLLEFRRHVLSRRDDSAFWRELHGAARQHPRASMELGVVILLITRVMGDFAPQALTAWTVDSLCRSIRLWVELYGYRVALGRHPGDKLHLLLQKEFELAGFAQKQKQPLRHSLLPLRMPAPVVRALPDESLPGRMRRYSMYPQLILERLRFHVVEGFRFAFESRRMRRMKESAQ